MDWRQRHVEHHIHDCLLASSRRNEATHGPAPSRQRELGHFIMGFARRSFVVALPTIDPLVRR